MNNQTPSNRVTILKTWSVQYIAQGKAIETAIKKSILSKKEITNDSFEKFRLWVPDLFPRDANVKKKLVSKITSKAIVESDPEDSNSDDESDCDLVSEKGAEKQSENESDSDSENESESDSEKETEKKTDNDSENESESESEKKSEKESVKVSEKEPEIESDSSDIEPVSTYDPLNPGLSSEKDCDTLSQVSGTTLATNLFKRKTPIPESITITQAEVNVSCTKRVAHKSKPGTSKKQKPNEVPNEFLTPLNKIDKTLEQASSKKMFETAIEDKEMQLKKKREERKALDVEIEKLDQGIAKRLDACTKRREKKHKAEIEKRKKAQERQKYLNAAEAEYKAKCAAAPSLY